MECTLAPEVLVKLDHSSTPFGIINTVTRMNEFLKIIVTEINRYATQKGRSFEATKGEIIAFLGIIFFMAINRLAAAEGYW